MKVYYSFIIEEAWTDFCPKHKKSDQDGFELPKIICGPTFSQSIKI